MLSRRLLGERRERVEQVSRVPLPPGTLLGAELADPPALTRALIRATQGLRHSRLSGALRGVMALPPVATVVGHAAVSDLSPGWRCARATEPLRLLEPGVLATAERYLGIERSALAVDWFIEDPGGAPERVTIAAASRHHIEARVEAAAAAGIVLAAIDDEAAAALRACRYAAGRELGAGEAYAVLWFGVGAVCGWIVIDGAARRELRYPQRGAGTLADALAMLVGGFNVQCALIGGEFGLLDAAGMSVADLGGALGCIMLPFDWCSFDAPCGDQPGIGALTDRGRSIQRRQATPQATPQTTRQTTAQKTPRSTPAWTPQPEPEISPDDYFDRPAFAVAFGLALRGLDE